MKKMKKLGFVPLLLSVLGCAVVESGSSRDEDEAVQGNENVATPQKGGTGTGTGTGSGSDAPELERIPCGIAKMLSEDCSSCHSDSPTFGAPMSITSYEDLMAASITQPSRSVFDVLLDRVEDPSRPMPPAPYERLD